jgi:formylglycine-generating enzyme required for sulfatase activity
MDWLPVTPGGEIQIEGQTFAVQPFYVARYLVTYCQFQAFVDAPDGFRNERWWVGMPDQYQRQAMSSAVAQYDNYPRDSVSWYQSVAFSRWLNDRCRGLVLPNPANEQAAVWKVNEEAEIRLPTEWEWQWMAQHGTEARKYPWGEWDGNPRANTTEAGIGDRSTAVGMYPQGAAASGALDVAGNLWEWCLNDRKNPEIVNGYSNEESKVLRGGSFSHVQPFAAASCRSSNNPYSRDYNYGFRLVVAAPIASLASDSLNSESL